jgi:hypothetical protein
VNRTALLVSVLVLAGCGAAAKPARPTLPRSLAHHWAARADAIAAARPCAGHRAATALRADAIAAVNRHRIPSELLEPLMSRMNLLATRETCASATREARALAAWLRASS